MTKKIVGDGHNPWNMKEEEMKLVEKMKKVNRREDRVSEEEKNWWKVGRR